MSYACMCAHFTFLREQAIMTSDSAATWVNLGSRCF